MRTRMRMISGQKNEEEEEKNPRCLIFQLSFGCDLKGERESGGGVSPHNRPTLLAPGKFNTSQRRRRDGAIGLPTWSCGRVSSASESQSAESRFTDNDHLRHI